MANLRFLIANIVDDATLTADPAMVESGGLTRLNLQKATERARTARTTSLASQDVKLTWAANQTANTMWLARNNMTTAGTLQPRLYSDAAWTTNTYAPTASAAFVTSSLDAIDSARYTERDFLHLKHTVIYFTERTDIRSAIARFVDAANADGYVEATKLLMGKYREVTYNPPVGNVELVQMDAGKGGRADDGSHIVDKSWKARRLTINLEHVPDADVTWLLAMARYLGLDKECAVDLYPEDTSAKGIYNRAIVRIVSAPGIGPTQYGMHRNSLVLEET